MYIRNIDNIFCNIKKQVNDVKECKHCSAQTLLSATFVSVCSVRILVSPRTSALRRIRRMRSRFLNTAPAYENAQP